MLEALKILKKENALIFWILEIIDTIIPIYKMLLINMERKTLNIILLPIAPKIGWFKREDFYMRHFDSTNRKKGYNIETAERHTLSEETKKKIAISVSKVRAGKKHSEETKIKISGALTGKNNPNYGKTKSKETKEKISTSVHLFLTENPRKISEEQKIKISNSLKKSPYSNLGKLMSEEQKSKISRSVSKSMKGKIKSNEHKKNLSIALKKYYNSLPNPTKSLPHLTRN